MTGKQKITEREVEYVARLARLILTDEEKGEMTRTLNDILVYMEKLGELDTTGVEPMTHAIPNVNVMRDDIVSPSGLSLDIQENAPEKKGAFFAVPRVIE